MSDWRISVFERDNTNTNEVSGPLIAATAFKAPKGPNEFTRFEKGAVQDIVDIFGYPSVDYPGIQDAIDFVQTAPIYLAAPVGSNAKYGGVFVTSAGSLPFVSGTPGKSIANYAAISCTHQVGVGNGVATSFNVTLPLKTYYNNQSITNVMNGATSITVSATNAATEVLSGTGLTTGSEYVRSSGSLTLVFSSAPALGAVITVTYTINISSIVYCTLFSKYAQADDLKVKVIENPDQADTFMAYVYRLDPLQSGNVYVEVADSPFYFGLNALDKNDDGESIYIQNVFGDNQILLSATVQNSVVGTVVDDASPVALVGGSRGTFTDNDAVNSAIATIFGTLTDKNKYPVSLVFDVTGASSVVSVLAGLRSGSLGDVTFAYPTPNLSATTLLADVATYRPTSNRGLICYPLTWGVHYDTFQANDFLCSNMGLVAERIITSMLLDPSAQPSYINENGCGGQLKAGIKSLSQTLSSTEAEQFEIAHMNPVTIDPFYGAMIVGWRTTASSNNVYSYIAQSIQADMIIKRIKRDVLVPQQGKPNDDLHRTTAVNITNAILSEFAKGLDAKFVKCDLSNNTDDIRNQQKFVLSVAIRFISYAKTLTLNFVTTRFGIDVTEAVN